MNKVEKVSIGGYAFTLDADACAKAKTYLDSLTAHYCKSSGGSEIVEGIEERFAELLLERVAANSVVSAADVDAVIAILGIPEAIEDDEPQEAPRAPEAEPKKRLFRDMEGKMVGGVCGGLGAYFKLDPVIFRIAFVAVTLIMLLTDCDSWIFVGPLAYLVLWLCIPQAKTVSQRCAMRGESGTAEEIGRNISAGMSEIGEAAHRAGNSSAWPVLWRVICVCAGLLLLLIGISGLFAGIGIVVAGSVFDAGELVSSIEGAINGISLLDGLLAHKWFMALALAIYFIPFIGTCYLGIKLVFGFKSPAWMPGLSLFIFWLILLVAAGVILALNAEAPGLLPTEKFTL